MHVCMWYYKTKPFEIEGDHMILLSIIYQETSICNLTIVGVKTKIDMYLHFSLCSQLKEYLTWCTLDSLWLVTLMKI